MAEAEIDPSAGIVGDSDDNPFAECVIGLFRTKVIDHIGPWIWMREVEWKTRKWLAWHNNRRRLAPIGYIPPADAQEAFHANLNTLDMAAQSLNTSPSGRAGAVHKPMGPRPPLQNQRRSIKLFDDG